MRRRLSAALFAAALGCSAAASGLGVPYRVANLNQGGPQYPDKLGFLGELGGRALVLKTGYREDADEEEHSQAELWAAEPTSGGAEPLAGFVLHASFPDPEVIGTVQGRLLFRIDNESPVWTTDGTRAGTSLLAPSFVGSLNLVARVRIGDRMLLSDSDGMAWSTDGTPAGTEPLGAPFPWASVSADPVTLGRRAYYIAGRRIVATDGTAAGTSTLVELGDGELVGLAATSRRLYFIHWMSQGQDLWTSDGSPGGTRRLRRFGQAYGGTRIDLPLMGLAHGVVFPECSFGPGCHLAGVTDSFRFSRLTPDVHVPYPRSVVLHTGATSLLFADGDGGLWRTDGTRRGTKALGRCAGACRSWSNPPRLLARAGKRSLFSAPAAHDHRQVWVTDGTDAGTRPLDADCARREGCDTRLAAVSGDAALLEVDDIGRVSRKVARLDRPAVFPVPAPGEKGPAVASGDGFLVAGKVLVRLAADGSVRASMAIPGERDGDASPRSLIALGKQLVFTACDGERQRIYRTDGDPGAVTALADGPKGCSTYGPPVPPVALDGAVVVDARYGMVRVDEAGNAVTLLDSGAEAMVPMGDELVLLVPNWECSEEDGCLHGRWLMDVFVSPGGVAPASEAATLPMAPFGDHLALGDRLLISDPATAEGLFALQPSQAGAGLDPIRCPAGGDVCPPGELARLGGVAFLLAGDLWRIDGDAATRIAPPAGASEPFDGSDLAAVEGALYFVSQPAGEDHVWLYRSDGSAAGTVALAPIDDHYRQIAFRPLGLDGKVYFTAYTPELGEELWVSDGTAAGTRPFLDLREGAEGSRPLLLGVAAGRLFFAADDGEHGVELWSTDGVAAHTAMVADIAPGPLSAWPGRPVLAGGTLYFAAEDGIAGSELWAVPVAP